jgi:hydrogenase maturation protease
MLRRQILGFRAVIDFSDLPDSVTRVANILKALIIGYGSPIRGDDAIGPLAADRIAELNLPGVEVQARHILTAELVEDLVRAERAIFLDAAADTEPGEVRCQEIGPDAGRLSTMAHFHDPRELLAWCEALYGRAPRAWLITAGGADFGYASYRLTATAEAALQTVVETALERAGNTASQSA